MPTVSLLIPASALTEQARSAKLAALRDQIADIFARRFNISPDDVVVRHAEPNVDLGFADTQQVSGALTADTETDYVNQDLTNVQKVVAFYGIANLSANPSINRVRFKVGASPGTSTKASVYLEPLYAGGTPVEGWLDQPVIYVGERMLVRVEAYQNVSGERLVLLGLVAEKKGTVV